MIKVFSNVLLVLFVFILCSLFIYFLSSNDSSFEGSQGRIVIWAISTFISIICLGVLYSVCFTLKTNYLLYTLIGYVIMEFSYYAISPNFGGSLIIIDLFEKKVQSFSIPYFYSFSISYLISTALLIYLKKRK
jgi:hypothetical protein